MRFVPHQNLSWTPSIGIYCIMVPLRENISDLPIHLNVHAPTLFDFSREREYLGSKNKDVCIICIMENKPFFWAGTDNSRISFGFATQRGHVQGFFAHKNSNMSTLILNILWKFKIKPMTLRTRGILIAVIRWALLSRRDEWYTATTYQFSVDQFFL